MNDDDGDYNDEEKEKKERERDVSRTIYTMRTVSHCNLIDDDDFGKRKESKEDNWLIHSSISSFLKEKFKSIN